MLRNRAVALILGLVASPLVIALGLGSLHSESALNEPFNGRIEIIGATADDFDALKVGLATRDQFDRAGIALHPLLYKLKFGVEESESGDNFISVTSKDPIREPYLNFLVEMNWANGRLLREYTVLLNPSLYDENRGRSQPEVVAVAPATESPSEPPVAGTPIASSDDARATSAAGPYSAGREIGPIVATDTLWSIASLNRPDESVSVQQMMLALLRENPDAFVDGNINLLRRGAILRLPEAASIGGVSAQAAFEEARRQHQVWEQYRDQVSAEPSAQLIGAEATPPARPATSTPVADSDGRLELVAPQGEDGGAAPGSGAGEDLLTEALDATTQDNAELTGKLLEAEEIIDLLQSQVNIQDSELAALQARLATLGVELGDDTLSQRAGIGSEAADGQATDDGAPVGADADSTVAEQDDETAIETDSATQLDSDDTVVEVDEDQDAAAYDEINEVVVDYEPAPEAAPGFPANLIPPHLAAAVPGGALTILGVAALLILVLFGGIVGFLMRRRGADNPTPAANESPAAEAQDDDEDATITAGSLDDAAEAVTEIGDSDKSFDANATVEAEAADDEAITEIPLAASEAPVDEEPEEDPLEEMNVYLAYERFDQAEELCKRVIGEHPDRHDYKLRLLEVYYSSNDRVAYETSARELFDVVSEGDPLRDSAVAMWSEMSPDRALFEEGGDAQAQPEQEQASAFVDITGDAEPGEDTVAHAPGDDDDNVDFDLSGDASGDVVDLTASDDTVEVVPGSGPSKASDDGVLDLTAVDDGSAVDAVTAGTGDDDGMIDLTAGTGEDDLATGPAADDTIDSTVADDGGVLDLTADTDDDEVLDLTATAGEDDVLDLSLGDDDGIFDLTAGDDEEPVATGDDDLLDLTDGGEEVDLLEVTAGGNTDAAMGSDLLNVASDNDTDLLDVTRTGDVSSFDDADLLNVTSPGLSGDEEFSADEPELDVNLEITDTAEESVLDFDISETVATAFDEETATEQTSATDGDDILDLTGGGSAEDSDDALMDFDIGALNADSSDIDPEAPTMVDGRLDALDEDAILTVDLDSALSEESASVDSGAELDFDITMGSEELNSALDVVEEDDGDGRLEITMSSADDDPVDGDVALQGEELGEMSLGLGDDEEFDFALDGTTEMDSIGADETLDMGSVSTQDGGEISIDTDIGTSLDELAVQLEEGGDDDAFSLDLDGLEVDGEIDSELDHLDTVAMEPGDDGEPEDADDKTLVMPLSDPVERQSDADEADTKLNLAKAYIELGDSDGARSILDEVATEGNEIQQAEAQSLLSQLT